MRTILRVSLFWLWVLSGAAYGGETIVFGEKTFERIVGKPETSVDRFSVEAPGENYRIRIRNGGPDGRLHPAKYATVRLNGVTLFGGKDFGSGNTWLEAPVRLLANNELAVTLKGRKGSGFALAIIADGDSTENRAPVAYGDRYELEEDQALSVGAASGVLANDTDADGNALTAILVEGPQHGRLEFAADGSFTYTPSPDFHGSEGFRYKSNDGALDSEAVTVVLTINPVIDAAPVVRFEASPTHITAGGFAALNWATEHASSVTIEPGIGSVAVAGSLSVSPAATTTYTLTAIGPDEASTAQVTVTVIPPAPSIQFSAEPAMIRPGQSAVLNWEVGFAGRVVISPEIGEVGTSGSRAVSPAVTTRYELVASGEGGETRQFASVQVLDAELPPDPREVAPELNPTESTRFDEATSFLYTGNNPIQKGVNPAVLEPTRVAVIRGRVLNRQNDPLPGVKITVKNHPEYGWTLSRADGHFDLVVNGGGTLTLDYAAAGSLPAQRQVLTPWRDFVWADDVVLVALDSQVTPVQLGASAMQAAQGSPMTDEAGTRQATVLFPAGVGATLTLADGSTRSLDSVNFRATEYTVGQNGFDAMPGPLPPTSAYTYAVELSADEAIAAGAKRIDFSRPLPLYVDNFLDFPVGQAVPAGWYDRDKAAWIPSDNGRIIAILSIENHLAQLDLDGSGRPADADQLAILGIDDEERAQLARLYPVGKRLWRTPIRHFTPWDCNWPLGPPADAMPPGGLPEKPDSDHPKDSDEDDECSGCSISPQGQTLGESIPVAATPYRLHYQSERMPGYKAGRMINIPLSGASVPASLEAIGLVVDFAGRRIVQRYEPEPNQHHSFEWDGLDAYGRKVYGSVRATVAVTYYYPCNYVSGGNGFAQFGGSAEVIGTRLACQSMAFPKRTELTLLSPFQMVDSPLGQWSLDVHHAWDPVADRVSLGDGGFRGMDFGAIHTVAGNGQPGGNGDGGPAKGAGLYSPSGVAFGPDGSFYIADRYNHRIRRVDPDGSIATIAGSGLSGFGGDGGPALAAQLSYPTSIALSPEGGLYIADSANRRIRYLRPDGIIVTAAGSGVAQGYLGDGGPAAEAELTYPTGLAVSPDGSLYIADGDGGRIRRVGPDGLINTVAGNGTAGDGGDGGPASEAALWYPADIGFGPDDGLYIADCGNHRVRRVGVDGIITTVAGSGVWGFGGDGGPATEAAFDCPSSVAFGPDGGLYIADESSFRIRRVGPDGIINTVAGKGAWFGEPGDGGPATEAVLSPPFDLAFDPSGGLNIADGGNHRIRRLQTDGLYRRETYLFSSKDGASQYHFNAGGRHLRTLNTLTGALTHEFGYDAEGRLISVTDGDGNLTTIERDGMGGVAAIVAPDGQRTALSQDAEGYLASVTNPAGETYRMEYAEGGLMTLFQDRNGNRNRFEYDALGRLTQDSNAIGGGWTIARNELERGYSVAMTSGEGRVQSFLVEPKTTGDRLQVNTRADGTRLETLYKTNGETVVTYPDGTVSQRKLSPDPRFGMQAPVVAESAVKLPSGLSSLTTTTKTVALSDPSDLLSLTTETVTTTVNGRAYTSRYDAATRTYTDTSPEGRTRIRTLDDKGRVTSLQTPGLDRVDVRYDARGRVQGVTQGSGSEVRNFTIAYDRSGNVGSTTDPLGRVTTFDYDAVGRVTAQEAPDGAVLSLSYDANGNVTGITPPESAQHRFIYNAADLLAEYNPPEIGLSRHSTYNRYNRDQELTAIERPDEDALSIDHEAQSGRLAGLDHGSGAIRYGYDADTGQLTGIGGPGEASLSYAYDGFLLTRESWTGPVSGSVGYTYDKDFRVASFDVAGATVNFAYDQDNLLTRAGDLALLRDSQTGWLAGASLGATATSQGYNGYGELTSFSAEALGRALLSTSHVRDKLGRITTKTETVNGVTHRYGYAYDAAGRLVEVTLDGAVTDTFSYDANGNRLSHNGTNARYDGQDRLLAYGGNAYAYTANGELREKTAEGAVTRYAYDALGNLLTAALPDGRSIAYLVDGRNRRIGKQVGGTLVQGFLYRDQLNPVAELNGDGSLKSLFVYAEQAHVPSYMVKAGITYRIVSDHLGSVRMVVNAQTGEVAQELDYDAYGKVLKDTNPGFQPFGFAGGLYDADTGLVRFGARDYDAETGRWTAKDPIGFNGGQANLYAYVGGNPVRYIDPTGLNPALALYRSFNVGYRIGESINPYVQPMIARALDAVLMQEKTPNSGEPGSCHVNPGSGQERKYGSDGLPESDIDWDHDHGQGVPHGHNWDRGPSGEPVRGPGLPISPWPSGRGSGG